MQNELLAKHPDAELAVYAFWFDMLDSDSRSRWPKDLLTDRRVTHFWDEKKVVGRWFASHPDYGGLYGGPVLWDAYLLYDRNARWEKAPSDLVSWGFTIVRTRERLEKDLQKLWSASQPSKEVQ